MRNETETVAVILAAGLGSRLSSVHADAPKGFVAVAGEPLAARSTRLLAAAGVREQVLVAGWRGDVYHDWARTERPGLRLVDNPDYAQTGSLRSLLLGAAAAPGRDLFVAESDLLYEARAPRLLLAGAPDAILVGGFSRSHDEVWVYADECGELLRLDKTRLAGNAPVGELVGLSWFSAATLAALAEVAPRLPATAHYEDGLNAIRERRPISLRHAPDLLWCEIDDPHHLARARSEIWPRIAAADDADAGSRSSGPTR